MIIERVARVSIVLSFGVGLGILLGSGCAGGSDEKDSQCIYPCEGPSEWYICVQNEAEKDWICVDDQLTAQNWCEAYVDPFAKAIPANCASDGTTGPDEEETTFGGLPWDPSIHVAYNPSSGAYEIDADFVNTLKADGFAPISNNDSTRLYLADSGYYELERVEPGDLADELGLQSGDALKHVNGYDLGSLDALIEAYQALESQTEFTLTIERAGRRLQLRYELVS